MVSFTLIVSLPSPLSVAVVAEYKVTIAEAGEASTAVILEKSAASEVIA